MTTQTLPSPSPRSHCDRPEEGNAAPKNTQARSALPPRVWHSGAMHPLDCEEVHTTLLDFLRIGRGDLAVKEACAQGDCGACAVAVAQLDARGNLQWSSMNSCIKPVHAMNRKAVFSARDLPPEHPVIRAMLHYESSQCGFCTPGFVMSLFAVYQEARVRQEEGRSRALGREEVLEAISGNLCRCTGYLPIVDAGLAMLQLPPVPAFEQKIEAMHRALQHERAQDPAPGPQLEDVLRRRANERDAWVVAGATDLGLRITKAHQRPQSMIDVSGVNAMRRLGTDDQGLWLGAAIDLQQAFECLAGHWPSLREYLWRFAGRQIRNSATLGGNLGTASPIGDAIPLLMVLGAQAQLHRWDVEADAIRDRSLAIEDFILGYRQTALQADELISAVLIPAEMLDWQLAAWKISKRYEDDISAVTLAAAWRSDPDGRIGTIRLAAGGVADRALRLRIVEDFLTGKARVRSELAKAQELVRSAIAPISDARASAAYRREVCANLLLRLAA